MKWNEVKSAISYAFIQFKRSRKVFQKTLGQICAFGLRFFNLISIHLFTEADRSSMYGLRLNKI